MNLSKQLGLGAIISFNVKGMEKLKHLGTRMNEVRTNATRMGKSVGEQVHRMNRAFSDMRAGLMKGTMIMAAGAAMVAPLVLITKEANEAHQSVRDFAELFILEFSKVEALAKGQKMSDAIRDAMMLDPVEHNLADVRTALWDMQSGLQDVDLALAAMRPSWDLATAGMGTVSDATQAMTGSLHQYRKQWESEGLSIEKMASRTANVLAAGVSAFQTKLPPLSQALKYALPYASQLGMKYEELVATIGMLQTKGLPGEQAGTSLAAFLRGIVRFSDKAGKDVNLKSISVDKLFEEIDSLMKSGGKASSKLAGLKVTDATGHLLPILDIIRNLEQIAGVSKDKIVGALKDVDDGAVSMTDTMSNLGLPLEFVSALMKELQEEGSRAALVLMGNSEELEKNIKLLSEADAAERMAQLRREGAVLSWAAIRNQIKLLVEEIGRSLEPAQDGIVAQFREWILVAFKFVQEHPMLVKAIFAITAAIAGITIALGAVTIAWTILNALFIASPVGWIVLAIGAALASMAIQIYLIVKYWDEITAAVRWAYDTIKDTPDALLLLISAPLLIVKHWDKVKVVLGSVWRLFKIIAVQWWEGAKIFWDSLKANIELIKGMGTAIVDTFAWVWDAIKDNPIISLLGKILGVEFGAIGNLLSGDFFDNVLDAINSVLPKAPLSPMPAFPTGSVNSVANGTNYVELPVNNQNTLNVEIHPSPNLDEKAIGAFTIREWEKYLRLRELSGPGGRF